MSDAVLSIQAPTDFEGRFLQPGDPGYDEAREVANGMFDRRPAAIACCTSPADVATALRVAREAGLDVTVRGGGHGATGSAVVDGALEIDCAPMKRIEVDADARRAVAGAGVIWRELDAATQEHGLAVTGGRVSNTGIAGLTLGSGSGWLERAFGLTADNLLAATVVTADGRVVRASADENPDLFFALRGGGGNFGVVCEFELALHPLGPIIAGGMIVHPIERAAEVMRAYRDWIEQAPDEVGGALALIAIPPAPFVTPEMVGRPALGIIATHTGTPEEGMEALAPLKELGEPLIDLMAPMPYVAIQQLLDEGNPWGARAYFKAAFMSDLPDAAIDELVALCQQSPSPLTALLLQPLGGAFARVPEDETALGNRDTKWVWHALATWTDARDDAANLEFARRVGATMEPYSRQAVHPNFVSDTGAARVRAFYTERTWERLVAAKRRWDPDNVFRHNQNVPPTG
jgi:FAD/FMN-containing dehydrogenase